MSVGAPRSLRTAGAAFDVDTAFGSGAAGDGDSRGGVGAATGAGGCAAGTAADGAGVAGGDAEPFDDRHRIVASTMAISATTPMNVTTASLGA